MLSQIIAQLLHYLTFVSAIVILLGGVIAIHEFGHFIFAKWAGIRVDTFSIGFGPKIWARKYGETEYCLSLIPLGGFVKIYGQDPEELANDTNPQPDRAFVKKSLGQKVSVLFGGPLLNYVLAVFLFSLLAVAGVYKLPAVATRVVAETPAYMAGLRSGDVILAIQDKATKTFDDVADFIAENPEKPLKFSIVREGQPQDLTIQVQKEHALTPYGEESIAGVLEGLEPLGREPILATTNQNHPWGFKNGDKILEINGQAVDSWESVEKIVSRALLSSVYSFKFKVQRENQTLELASGDAKSLAQKSKNDLHEFLELAGIHNPELFIQEVAKGSPAAEAGLQSGDRIISVDGKRVHSFDHLRATVQDAGERAAKKAGTNLTDSTLPKALIVNIERNGQKQKIESAIKATKGKDPLGTAIVTYTIGIQSAGKPQMPTNLIMERTFNPFKAFWIGLSETGKNTVMTVVGLKKLAMGEVSAKTVGGPIMIGKLAGDTLVSRGWRDFLRIMAIISISLGVFNLIPVPILDGGHIVFAVVESMRGKPLSQNVQQAALKVGLSLILVLMVFALYNDISRVIPLPF